MSEVKRISASMLSTMSGCPQQVYHRYVKGIIKPPGIAAVMGKTAAAASEIDLQCKIDNGHLLPDEEIQDLAATEFDKEWTTGVDLTPEEKKRGAKKVKGECKDQTIRLATAHHGMIAPVLSPIEVERRIDLTIDGFGYDLSGYIDVVEGDQLKDWIRLRDLKTRSKKPSPDEAADSIQMQLYSMAVEVVDGIKPASVHLDVLVKRKKGDPEYIEVNAPGPDNYTALLRRIKLCGDVLDSGVFYPTSPDDWRCSERWCGYHDICDFGRKRKVQG